MLQRFAMLPVSDLWCGGVSGPALLSYSSPHPAQGQTPGTGHAIFAESMEEGRSTGNEQLGVGMDCTGRSRGHCAE